MENSVVTNRTRTQSVKRLSAVLLVAGVSLLMLAFGLAFPAAAQDGAPATQTPLPLYALPDARSRSASSNSLALAEDNRTLAVANMLNNTVSIVQPVQGNLVAEIPVGSDPRSLAFFNQDTQIVTANRGESTLSVVELETQRVSSIPLEGVWPYGLVIEGTIAYVSLQGSDQIAAVDLVAGEQIAYVDVPDAPAGLTLWGNFLYVSHFWSGQVTLVYVPEMRVVSTVSTGMDTGLFQAIELDVSRGIGYLPQTRSNAQNENLTFDTTVFPIVNVIDFRDMSIKRAQRIGLDTVDRPVNMPFAAALDRFRNWLYVANAGSNNVSVIDLGTGLARGNLEVGAHPRGLLLNRDNSLLFVNNTLDGTLTIIDTRDLDVVDQLPISDFNIPVDSLLAQQLFYSATDPRISNDSWISCGNCHFDGMSDGRTWMGFDGGRNTPLLYGLLETAPYNWDGSWDELADVEHKIRGLQAGTGLIRDAIIPLPLGDPMSGLSLDLNVLATYLSTLPGPANPYKPDPALVERGAEIFEAQGCAQCHLGTVGTDGERHDVGTGEEFDTPSLRWLWASGPYLHDGSAATLRDVFTAPGAHNLIRELAIADIDALVAYLVTLPQS
jgi:YVTN family beta-propeller protein